LAISRVRVFFWSDPLILHNFAASKKQPLMKHKLILVSTLLLCLIGIQKTTAVASELSDDTQIIIAGSGHKGDNPSRAPSTNGKTIEAIYNEETSSIYITFSSSPGDGFVHLAVENHSTGEYFSKDFESCLFVVMPISGKGGVYTITITLPDGIQYFGEFILN